MIDFRTYTQVIEEGQSVVDYLKMLQKNQNMKGMAYGGPADFVLKHGKQYESAELTPEEMGMLKEVLKGQCHYKVKQCFYNAQSIGLAGTIGYCEGYADSLGLPMEHAWNTINGKVIDMTWRFRRGGKPVLGVIPSGWEYFGVEFPAKLVRKQWSKGASAPLITNWEEGFPLLQQVFESKLVKEGTLKFDPMDDHAFEQAEREFMGRLDSDKWSSATRLVGIEQNIALKLQPPDFEVQGPSRTYDFWSIEKNRKKGDRGPLDDISYSNLYMRINRSGMGYPDSWYAVLDTDIGDVKELWKEIYETYN